MPKDSSSFPSIFQDFTQALGLQETYLDGDGNCSLLFGEDIPIAIHFSQDANEVVVYGEVADLKDIENRAPLLQNMMKANFFWLATKGFTFTVDKDSLLVLLMGREHADYFHDVETLATYLGACAETIRTWRESFQVAGLPDIPIMFPNPPNDETKDAPPSSADFLMNTFIVP